MLHYSLPAHYEDWIEDQLQRIGWSLTAPAKLAKAILKTSDFFANKGRGQTPWHDREAVAAYLAYYFPLNYLRTLRVISEGQRWGFFSDFEEVVDFGCGPGTVSKALYDSVGGNWSFTGIDRHGPLAELYGNGPAGSWRFRGDFQKPARPFLLCASYVLNELPEIPPWWAKAEAVMLIEPSTYHEAQRLQASRQWLKENGFFIWAPCLHQEVCPLLGHKKDWCHDRLHWEQPSWFSAIERHLPIKNPTLTFSYLLARRQSPPSREPMWRVIGDVREEKGKSKWMICAPDERTFVSCLHRRSSLPPIHRGDILKLTAVEKKVAEWRCQPEDIEVLEL